MSFERECRLNEECLMNDYFVEKPTYTPEIFRSRFRMRKSLFLHIVKAITINDDYFRETSDISCREGLSSLQICTGVMRVLAYGTSSDVVDEYLWMSEDMTREALINFVEGIISCFGDEYLRRPNEQDLIRLLHVGEQRGFPGMIGSIGCVHWEWKNCPASCVEQYARRSGKPTIFLEAAASYDMWIWHALFGTPGSRNDINVLYRSPHFSDVLEGLAPDVSYIVNGRENDMPYYLTDRIYPSWAAFVKSIIAPQLRKHKLFVQHQETVRKDVERACEVLLARFIFLQRPYLVWDKPLMERIMMACIIMHNMIVEDERYTYQTYDYPTDDDLHSQYSTQRIASLSSYMTSREQLRNREAHSALRNDLIEHIWQKFGTDN